MVLARRTYEYILCQLLKGSHQLGPPPSAPIQLPCPQSCESAGISFVYNMMRGAYEVEILDSSVNDLVPFLQDSNGVVRVEPYIDHRLFRQARHITMLQYLICQILSRKMKEHTISCHTNGVFDRPRIGRCVFAVNSFKASSNVHLFSCNDSTVSSSSSFPSVQSEDADIPCTSH
jgi:hypothetical protein